MALIEVNDIHLRFRGPSLLDGISCQIEAGQRIGLLGRNGAGKTTFMRILSEQIQPDTGTIRKQDETRISLLPQNVPTDLAGPIRDIVAQGLTTTSAGEDEADWRGETQVEQILSKMSLDGDAAIETLSSGMKRRVLLAQSLVSHPDVLLLDEPTNHLDIDAIQWLEKFLLGWRATFIFVTHDRMFLRKLATRILEIDRGNLFDWTCDYDTFLRRKEELLAAEEKQNALFDKKLAQEEVWIRQGIKARRTRNQGRVRALRKMRDERAERRGKQADVRMSIQQGQRSGKLVADVEKVSFAYDENVIVSDFSTTIMRGDKIGFIGPNGAGKTTLLRILLGQLEPQSGSVRQGVNLEVAYFDQLRGQLNEEETIQENVGDGYDNIYINEKPKHIIGYLQEFLFSPERARTQIKFLSGGERNRVLLAKLFAKPANVLVLDEPTNDLDAETLELLESLLVDFAGTILLVSHDREFLNNVVTSSIVFEETGVKEYDGGYDDWQRQVANREATAQTATSAKTIQKPSQSTNSNSAAARKLSYKEKTELAGLPQKIESLEKEIAEIHALMADPNFYQQAGGEIAQQQQRLAELDVDLTTSFERWEELEAMTNSK